jgi:predicted deacylase
MLKGKPDIPKKVKVYRPYHIYSERGGFFISDVRAGDMVRKGQVIGEIRNLYGDVVERIAVPQPGVIHMVTSPAIYQGDALFEIGTDIREKE